MKKMSLFFAGLIILGLTLRFQGLLTPDLFTDEAQFALGASAAQPPLGLLLFTLAQELFGASLLTVRLVSVLSGVATCVILSLASFTLWGRRAAQLTFLIALLLPSHILFSRLAYLSAPLALTWSLVLLTFIAARKDTTPHTLILLFGACILATLTKTQGLLLPCILLLDVVLERRLKVITDPIAITVTVSVIPILLFVATSPGILATFVQHGGGTYGVHNAGTRLTTLLSLWWSLSPVLVICILVCLNRFREIPWFVWGSVLLGSGIGFLLGPSHAYYSAHLVFWALPLAYVLSKTSHNMCLGALGALAINAALIASPSSPFVYEPFAKPGYWNTTADRVNEHLQNTEEVVVLGNAGHHIRWYLEKRVLVGKTMDLTNYDGYILSLDPSIVVQNAEVIMQDERITLLKR